MVGGSKERISIRSESTEVNECQIIEQNLEKF